MKKLKQYWVSRDEYVNGLFYVAMPIQAEILYIHGRRDAGFWIFVIEPVDSPKVNRRFNILGSVTEKYELPVDGGNHEYKYVCNFGTGSFDGFVFEDIDFNR